MQIRQIGLSNVAAQQVQDGGRIFAIARVQNQYTLAGRGDDALFHVATELSATPLQVALMWLLRRSPHVQRIPGTSSSAHLHENLAAAALSLPADTVRRFDAIGHCGAVCRRLIGSVLRQCWRQRCCVRATATIAVSSRSIA